MKNGGSMKKVLYYIFLSFFFLPAITSHAATSDHHQPHAYSKRYLERVDEMLDDIANHPELYTYKIAQLHKLLDRLPTKYINDVYYATGLQAVDGLYKFAGNRYIDPALSNQTLLKTAIIKTAPIDAEKQYNIIKKILEKGANPTYNPHYTSEEALLKIKKNTPQSQLYQYPPLWIALLTSNVGALKALLEAGVQTSSQTAAQVSNLSDRPEASLTLLELASDIHNPRIIDLLTQYGYQPPVPTEKKPAHRDSHVSIFAIKQLLQEIHKHPGLTHFRAAHLLKQLDALPADYVNDVYIGAGLTSLYGKYMFDGKQYVDPILSNATLLKMVIHTMKDCPLLYQVIQKLVEKGADPNYNPHYTDPEALAMLKTSAFYKEHYQYPPLWIAILQGKAYAVKALLEAGAQLTHQTSGQVTGITDNLIAGLTLREIARHLHNRHVIATLKKFGYTVD